MIRPKSPTALLQAVRIARQNPRARFEVPGQFPLDSSDVLRLWERGVHARASRWIELTEAQEREHELLLHDARVINDYVGKRIRHTGCRNLLRHPGMKARYPHIDNQPREF